ncbi:hypothetical protein FF38_14212 [Lucilia cuprina]|uniref:Uncharacterized protein n=1 Tax=Lucilia cuprina TaxID=7375 RepID=A0A0L0BPX4_LUCCU|nr:hypothetical protein FF38_14212 [Lucilia cuprina]
MAFMELSCSLDNFISAKSENKRSAGKRGFFKRSKSAFFLTRDDCLKRAAEGVLGNTGTTMGLRPLQGVLGSSSASLSSPEESLSLEELSLPDGAKSLSSPEKSEPEAASTSLAISIKFHFFQNLRFLTLLRTLEGVLGSNVFLALLPSGVLPSRPGVLGVVGILGVFIAAKAIPPFFFGVLKPNISLPASSTSSSSNCKSPAFGLATVSITKSVSSSSSSVTSVRALDCLLRLLLRPPPESKTKSPAYLLLGLIVRPDLLQVLDVSKVFSSSVSSTKTSKGSSAAELEAELSVFVS